MNAMTPSAPEGQGRDGLGEAAARKARHLAMLAQLVEVGTALACVTGQRAQAAADAMDGPALATEAFAPAAGKAARDWGLAFARLAACVRQTMALEARIAADGLAPRGPGKPGRDGTRGRDAETRTPPRDGAAAGAGAPEPQAAVATGGRPERPKPGCRLGPVAAQMAAAEMVAVIADDFGIAAGPKRARPPPLSMRRDLLRTTAPLWPAALAEPPGRPAGALVGSRLGGAASNPHFAHPHVAGT